VVRDKSTSIQYINIVRILAIYVVVTGHIAIWTTYTAPPMGLTWWVGKWIHLCALWVIPAFVMVTGTLLLDDSRNESPASFYKRRIYRIAIPIVFWTVLFLVIRVVVDKEDMTVARAARLILTADPYYHLWYLGMLPGLYLALPLVRIFVRHSTSKQRILLIALIFGLAGSYSTVNNLYLGNQRTIFTMFLPYIAYLLVGYEIPRIDPKNVPFKWLLAAVGICAAYVILLAFPFIDRLGVAATGPPYGRLDTPQFIYDAFCPPQIVLGIGIFWALYLIDRRTRQLRGIPKTVVEWMASTTLGIYVMHPLVLAYMRYRFSDESAEGGLLFTLTVGPLVAFITCYLASSLILNIPYLKRIIS